MQLMSSLRLGTMERTPVQTRRLHLLRKLGLDPKSTHRSNTKPNHEWPVSHMSNLVHQESHATHLTPRGRRRRPLGRGGDLRLLATCGPNLFLLDHAVFKECVDLGNFCLTQHNERWIGAVIAVQREGSSARLFGLDVS